MARPYQLLRELMVANDFTQYQLGEELNLNQCSVSQRMNAHTAWSSEEMWQIMRLFNIPAYRFHEVFPPKGINEPGVKRAGYRRKGA